MMIAPLTRAQTSFIAKDPISFRGGLLHWHNQSFVCATTWLFSVVPFETFTLAQRNKSIVFDLKMSLRDIAGYFSRDCMEHNWVYLRHFAGAPDCCKLLPCIDVHQSPPLVLMDLSPTLPEIMIVAKKLPPINITVAGYSISVKAKN